MTFILVILTSAVILSLELIRRSQVKPILANPELVLEHPASYDVFDRYFHPGHTWAMISGSSSVTVGVDDFSSCMIGNLSKIELPAIGQMIHQGDPFTLLCHGSRNLVQVSPISGKVVEVNKKLTRNPGLINDSPLKRGWIIKVLPTSLETDLRNLLKGVVADGWRDAVRTQLIQLFSPRIGIVVQDGGQLVQGLGDHLSDDEWNRLVRRFFPLITPIKFQNHQ
jgi:glycine cleavage system H lipoate-binding protein